MKDHQRVNFISTINAANVSKADGRFVIRDVVACVDDLVMNARLYPGDELAAGIKSLEGKPAPAGHPKDAKGHHISASDGIALNSNYIGAHCFNCRHEGGRSLVDLSVNEKQAMAMPEGEKLVAALNDAIEGKAVAPIHVSTGVYVREIALAGNSKGKDYRAVATNLKYDHLAILFNEKGAGTPEQGVGLFLNAEGEEEDVEVVQLNSEKPEVEDLRSKNVMTQMLRVFGFNADQKSFEDITNLLYQAVGEGNWPVQVYDREVVYIDRENKLWRQGYTVSGSKAVLAGDVTQVEREVSYKPVTNAQKGDEMLKDELIAALNAAGVQGTDKMNEAALLAAHAALANAPLQKQLEQLTANVNQLVQAQNSVNEKEIGDLAKQLATNGELTEDEYKALPVARLRELASKTRTAAPALPGGVVTNSNGYVPMAGSKYSLNADIDEELKTAH